MGKFLILPPRARTEKHPRPRSLCEKRVRVEKRAKIRMGEVVTGVDDLSPEVIGVRWEHLSSASVM